jgi:hypothetical protein
LPDAPKTFLMHVPVAWEETRVLDGEPGRGVTIARRAGTTWYVAGITADAPAAARVPLSFLGGGSWRMTLIADGASDRAFASRAATVSARDTIDVPTRARGGWVMTLTR